jgi:hypothetical protein
MMQITDSDYNGVEFDCERLGESPEYLNWIKEYSDGMDGPNTYSWDNGQIP